MDDREMDDLVAAAMPVTDRDVANLGLDGPVADLREAIMSTSADPTPAAVPAPAPGAEAEPDLYADPEEIVDGADARPSRRRRRPPRSRPVVVLAAVAAAVVVMIVAGLVGRGPREGVTTDDAPAANPDTPTSRAAVDPSALADGPPRLLIRAEGWEVTRVEEVRVEQGDMTFSGPDESLVLNLHWSTEPGGGLYDDGIAEGMERLPDVTITGHQAALFTSPEVDGEAVEGDGPEPTVPDEGPLFVAQWTDREYELELWGYLPDADAFLDVATTVEAVDAATWLAALPESTVSPEGLAGTVQTMLADVPLPPGLDPHALATGTGVVRDRYHLGVDVTGAVACGWIARWVDATATGDTAAAQEAVDAMGTSPEWDILQEMEPQGGWSEVVWELSAAMAGDGTVDRGRPDIPLADEYVNSLGCDSR